MKHQLCTEMVHYLTPMVAYNVDLQLINACGTLVAHQYQKKRCCKATSPSPLETC